MRLIALIVVILLALGFGVHKQQDNPATFSCGQVTTGGHQLNDKILTFVEDVGEFAHWIQEHKDDPIDQKGMERLARKMWREVLWLWFKAFMQSGTGTKLDPQILRLHEKAEQERQAAEDQCAPCPTATPVPPVGGVDPRVMLTVAQSTGTESESIVRGAVKIANQRGYGYSEKLAIVEAGLVESGLKLLPHGHSSSVGWLQLLASNGTYEQRMSIGYPANWFYDQMERLVPDHANTPPGDIAAMVQRPRADLRGKYAEREEDARKWLDRLGESPTDELSDVVGAGCSVDPTVDEPGGSFTTADFSRFQNPRSVAQAIEWLDGYVTSGRSIPSGMCLHYMALAYGYPGTNANGGPNWAIRSWDLTPAEYRVPRDPKPARGAVLYWNTGAGRPGHVAISAGNGMVYSTDQPARGEIGLVPMSAFDSYGEYKGSTAPFFFGQTKIADSRAVQA